MLDRFKNEFCQMMTSDITALEKKLFNKIKT